MKVNFSGKLFSPLLGNDLQKVPRKVLQQAVTIVKDKTPVVSGRLKKGWDISGNTIFNDVPYTFFVEEGTQYFEGRFMLRDSIPEIETRLLKSVSEEL